MLHKIAEDKNTDLQVKKIKNFLEIVVEILGETVKKF